MHRTLIVPLIVLLLATELSARSADNWEKVEKLKTGTVIEVVLWNGDDLSGNIDNVSDTRLYLTQFDRGISHASGGRALDRSSIRRIVRFRQANLPDSRRWMVTGTLAGGAIGVTAGTVADLKHGSSYHWLQGGVGGAGLGFLASCAALAAAGGIDIVKGLHRREVVYEDRSRHPAEGEIGKAAPSR